MGSGYSGGDAFFGAQIRVEDGLGSGGGRNFGLRGQGGRLRRLRKSMALAMEWSWDPWRVLASTENSGGIALPSFGTKSKKPKGAILDETRDTE